MKKQLALFVLVSSALTAVAAAVIHYKTKMVEIKTTLANTPADSSADDESSTAQSAPKEEIISKTTESRKYVTIPLPKRTEES